MSKRLKAVKRESDLYPGVQNWLRKRYQCFHTGANNGSAKSRIDVVGLRDIGGDLECEVEMVGVEVKKGAQPFFTCAGQAAGYGVYAHRVYLADYRNTGFTREEQEIAGFLRIGLLQIAGERRVIERVTAPRVEPIKRLYLQLVERLGYASCRVCGSAFRMSQSDANRFSGIGRANLRRSLLRQTPYMYWVEEQCERRRRFVGDSRKDNFARRYICPDCVENVLGKSIDLAVEGGVPVEE